MTYSNIYLMTTIYAVIGTAIYSLIAYFLYPSYVTVPYMIIAFVIVWIAYFIIYRKRHY